MYPGEARHGLRRGDALGDEQRLDQLIGLYVDLAREGTDMLVLAQAAQVERTHMVRPESK